MLQATIDQMKVLAEEKDCLLARNKALTEELQEFAYVASHDLKAPLRSILLLADWIADDVRPNAGSETLENLALMRQRAHRLQMQIDGLLAYTRAGHDNAPLERVDVGALVADIVGVLAPPSGFGVRFNGKAPVLYTPRPPLEHVLQNLISNAIKHHDRPCGAIVVSSRSIDGMIEFSVRDDGPGIAPEFHKRIFAIFKTLAGDDESEASGVGLSIVQKAVERFGGKVWVSSAPPARGATFAFTWPQSDVSSIAVESDLQQAAE
jgi:signal transduction histidine kinase